MSAEGIWTLIIDTPLGKQHAQAQLTQQPDGTWQGTARDLTSGVETPLTDITVRGDEVSWRQSITKPMRLNLVFNLTVDGDQLSGKAKAGRLPSSTVSGERVMDAEREPGAPR